MGNIRTDLAIEAHEMCSEERAEQKDSIPGIKIEKHSEGGVTVTAIEVTSAEGEKALGKPRGKYVTLEAPKLKYSDEVYENACMALADEIRGMCRLGGDTKVLVAGLGNKLITPDALGSEVVARLMVTNHVKMHMRDFLDSSYSSVCAITPGVLGTTGIETGDIIKGVADRIKPELVICIDALAARSTDRISTTIQLCDTGITPGSGVENKRQGINEQSLGVPVIAIGVPTVVDAATVAADSVDAALAGDESREAIKEALSKRQGNMMVTPKDIDLVITRAAKTVANGINLALHKNLTFSDIESYVG